MCEGLRKIGIDATSCSFLSHKFGFKAGINSHWDDLTKEESSKKRDDSYNHFIQPYDIFHFHFSRIDIMPSKAVRVMKKKGKKIVIQHRRSEVRKLSVARKMNNPYVQVKKY
ncbi:hypothetical protein [Halobacillus yeomjeoni]|uniref:Uncharacterized protein n=1 Tax=Halobacillus yeomjeoni TaxID=311194 RepID=A0A931MU17_9BACI|nr:hypothetical protein [Halobacillus yeomjeoni]MBH0228929.1 hypothetical protein [Halobacillus yeomjeoni]